MDGPYAQIKGKDLEFLMKKKKVVIGRDSKLGDVDLNLGSTRFISRRHLEIIWDSDFFYMCRGKNGVFVNDIFQRRENRRLPLPPLCEIRFPSTTIKVEFTSLISGTTPPVPPIQSPVSFHPKLDPPFCSPFVSPAPSPTGTISAVNSCPVSPNSEFRNRVPNFDLKVMATYASKLLSTQQYRQHPHHQQQQQHQQHQHQLQEGIHTEEEGQLSDENQEEHEVTEVVEASSASLDSCHLNSSNNGREAPPTSMETLDEEDEDGEGGESSQGGVASDTGAGGSGGEEKSQQKPPYSYAQLIVQALLASKDHRQTLNSIYTFIADMYPYYKLGDKGWKNSIRHNLSLNQYFAKAPREKEGLGFGKGGYWCMHPDYKDKLTSQAYVKRKKKGIPVFPSSHLISSRSAPPSPTHHPCNDLPLSSLKEMNHSTAAATVETPRLTLPLPPSTSHFTLNTYFPNLPQAVNSSHSLPASPSRPPTFPPGAAKFFPMAAKKERDEDINSKEAPIASAPVMKKPRLDDEVSGIIKPRPIPLGPPGQAIPTTSLGSLGNIVSLPPVTMHQHHPMTGAPPPLFIPISLTAAAAGLANPQRPPTLPPPQNMPLPPHPFLSGYFNCGAQALPLPVPATAANSAPTNPSSE